MRKHTRNRLAMIATLYPNVDTQVIVENIWLQYETEIHNSIRNHGSEYALKLYKAGYVWLRNKFLHISPSPIPFCKVDSNGVPKILWSLRPLIKDEGTSQRVALSIARSYELIVLPIDYSTKSIEEPFLEGKDFQETTMLFKWFLEQFTHKFQWYLGSLQLRNPNGSQVFTTLARGPNGPAVSTAHLDAKGVTTDPILFNHIVNLNSALQQEWITQWMVNQSGTVNNEETYHTGRLGFSAEPGGKTRIFAIGDYWSQCSLKVIQDSMYRTLKTLSTDATSNQDKGFKSLMEMARGKRTYCFDLSSASDRIPVLLQTFRLNLMSGKNLGELWRSVMTDRNFYIKHNGRNVRWSVGQPLGILSSFPSFALWHHDFIQFCYNLPRIEEGLPLKFFKGYRVLGDDVVILDEKVAGSYQRLMSVIGVEINLQKSVIGDSVNSQIEFAKRLSLRGKEISSLKRNILTKTSIFDMLDLIDLMREREFIPTDMDRFHRYPFLTPKEEIEFNFMLWFRQNLTPSFEGGNVTCPIDRNEFNTKLKELRYQNILEKTQFIDKYLCEALPLNEYYDKFSIPRNEEALGLGRLDNPLKLHPIVWAINQTGMELSDKLNDIWDESPDVAPVEYLPMVNHKSYFSTPRTKGKEVLASLIIKSYNELVGTK